MIMDELEVTTSPEDLFDMEYDSPLGGRVIVVAPSSKSTMNYESSEDKAHEIRECLQLLEENSGCNVDLWELRQLALSPGGLLSPSLRQVAWPLLTGLSLSRLEEDGDQEIMDKGLAETMQNDIAQTVWHVEELVRQSQMGKDSFWYVPLPHSNTTSALESDAAPGLVLSSPCSSSETSQDESQVTTTNSSLKPSAGPTSQDQILLKKVLTKVLQGKTEYSTTGLANLAALVMINLESTSLSSLLLSQLAAYHLKAVFTEDGSMEALVSSLMKRFTPNSRTTSSTSQALTWFSGTQTSNLQVASRLIDTFLVSHPLLPLYFATAAVDADAPWTMEKVEELITTSLDYMQQFSPADLLATATPASALPSTPAWAIAATARADWAHPPTLAAPIQRAENCQQDEPFSDEDTNCDWERLSTSSQAEGDNVGEDNTTSAPIVPLQETFFFESYPLAAAGLAIPTSKTKSRPLLPPTTEPPNKGGHLLKLAFLVSAILVILAVFWSQSSSSMPASQTANVKASEPHLPSPQPIVQRLVAPTGSIPTEKPRVFQEKFLGLLPVARPAPKKVLRVSMSAPRAPKTVPTMMVSHSEAPKMSPPSSPRPMMMAKPQQPSLMPTDLKPKVMVRMDISKKKSSAAPRESERSLQKDVSTVSVRAKKTQNDALESPSRKFHPLISVKKQLRKVGELWKRLVKLFRRGKKEM